MWYQTWFDKDEYAFVYNKRNDADAERLLDLLEKTLALPKQSRILDMACGRGRHAIALAQRGFMVTGIDLSPRSIAAAQEKANALGLAIDFRVRDMREAVAENFDAVFNLFSSFGYFETDSEHLKALWVMKNALKPHGVLVQDFMNAAYVEKHLVPFDERIENDIQITQERWIANQRINKRITLKKLNADEPEQVFTESVALLKLADFERFYAELGLKITHIFGDYHGNGLTEESSRLILVSV